MLLCEMSLAGKILIPAAILLAIAFVFSILLAILGKKLAVKQDEKVEAISHLLSGANCGGCGYAGCDDFAKAVAEGKVEPDACLATSKKNKKEIAKILGKADVSGETQIVIHCSGGTAAKDKYTYQGFGDCNSMVMLSGGRKLCEKGCLGMGSCTDNCVKHAVAVNGNLGYATLQREKCVNCGRCIKSCPKGLISRIPITAKYYVACSNPDRGKIVKDVCSRGCIGCGICEKQCPNHAITITDNLPIFDYSLCTSCGKCAEKCPQKVIHSVQ